MRSKTKRAKFGRLLVVSICSLGGLLFFNHLWHLRQPQLNQSKNPTPAASGVNALTDAPRQRATQTAPPISSPSSFSTPNSPALAKSQTQISKPMERHGASAA